MRALLDFRIRVISINRCVFINHTPLVPTTSVLRDSTKTVRLTQFFNHQKIDHAGYTRYILHRNPPRYDSEGEEIDGDEEPDTEAEAEAAEDNPFAGIALERTSHSISTSLRG